MPGLDAGASGGDPMVLNSTGGVDPILKGDLEAGALVERFDTETLSDSSLK